LLGRIVEKAAGVGYEEYVRTRILGPLGMGATTFEAAKVSRERLAVGYRLRPDGSYGEEPALPHGVFGAMGGLLTSARDLGKYVAFHLAAWPPRDEAEAGPVRRASVREMSQMWTRSNVTASFGGKEAGVSGYGYGLRITSDCRFEHMVGHGGGLPGYGSYMAWLPEHGVGIFAMGTLTYSGPSRVIRRAFEAMERTGGLGKREMPVSRDLEAMRGPLAALWKSWDDGAARKVAAMNLLLDRPGAERRAEIERLRGEVGACGEAGPVRAENWMRGQFNMRCEKGVVGVFYTLAPTRPAGVQHLEYRVLGSAGEQMVAPTGAPAGVSCVD
jgi:CubicO group peptidase (beta-lactamase class C family)